MVTSSSLFEDYTTKPELGKACLNTDISNPRHVCDKRSLWHSLKLTMAILFPHETTRVQAILSIPFPICLQLRYGTTFLWSKTRWDHEVQYCCKTTLKFCHQRSTSTRRVIRQRMDVLLGSAVKFNYNPHLTETDALQGAHCPPSNSQCHSSLVTFLLNFNTSKEEWRLDIILISPFCLVLGVDPCERALPSRYVDGAGTVSLQRWEKVSG